MNAPTPPLSLNHDQFTKWLRGASFEKWGDKFERKYYAQLQVDFPRNEEFWRVFVVPLTNRITGEKPGQSIHFRDGVDPVLQSICGANYSLFTQLAFSRVILANWDDASSSAIYARLASAFDVFETLVIKFNLLLYECRGLAFPLLGGLSEEQFLGLAKDYYRAEYPKLQELYLQVGKKPPPFTIPTKGEIIAEFLKQTGHRKEYQKASGEIRAFRNVIVHDVRVGMLVGPDKTILVPKSSEIQKAKYRRWAEVEQAGKEPAIIKADFCEVKDQCRQEADRTLRTLNDIYGHVLTEFDAEFYSAERSRLRDLFGIRFDDSSWMKLPPNPDEAVFEDSGSYTYATASTDAPVQLPDSGVFMPPPREGPSSC